MKSRRKVDDKEDTVTSGGQRSMLSRRRALGVSIGCLTTAAMLVAVPRLFPPGPDSPYPRCLFHALTDRYCLTCGGTRALAFLAHGRFLHALHMNAVVVIGWAGLVYAGLACAVYGLGAPHLLLPRITRKRIGVLLLILLAFWVLRNLPLGPFRRLAPE